MTKKQMTIEDLARMVQHGFAETATKKELNKFRKEVHERFNIVEADIRDIKITLGPLVQIVAALNVDVKNLTMRVNRLERKVGFAR